jgi:WD40 repeat protein
LHIRANSIERFESVYLWNQSGQLITKLKQPKLLAATIGPDAKAIATTDISCNSVQLWNQSGQKLAELKVPGKFINVMFSPNGKSIATFSEDSEGTGDYTVRLWDIAGQLCLALCLLRKQP